MWKKQPVDGKQDWPYTQFSESGGIVTLSGQNGTVDGVLVIGGIEEETRQAINNCMSIVHRLGMDERHVLDVQVVLFDIDNDREGFEKVYHDELFPDPKDRPSRTLFGGNPANHSRIDIKMMLSRSLPFRGPVGEPEPWGGDKESHPDIP